MDFTMLREYLDRAVRERVPGVDCAVNYKGERVFRYSAGLGDIASGSPVARDSLYNIYSMSKVVTCAAALQLFERGAYLLDDPAGDYIPEFNDAVVRVKNPDGTTGTEPCTRKITVRDLFTMSAGFTYNPNVPSVRELREKTGGDFGTQDFIKALLREPLAFQPGSRWSYSLCHDALGALIEVWSGMPFGEYLAKNIFGPCGMSDTGFALPPEKEARFASQYRRTENPHGYEFVGNVNTFRYSGRYESGGAGLISTVDDYSRFAEALAHGGVAATGERILSSRTINLMRGNQIEEHRLGIYRDSLSKSGYGYGLGVRTMMSPELAGSLSPVGEFGWSGAAGSYVLIDPDNSLTLVYFQHLLNCQNAIIHPRLRSALYAGL